MRFIKKISISIIMMMAMLLIFGSIDYKYCKANDRLDVKAGVTYEEDEIDDETGDKIHSEVIVQDDESYFDYRVRRLVYRETITSNDGSVRKATKRATYYYYTNGKRKEEATIEYEDGTKEETTSSYDVEAGRFMTVVNTKVVMDKEGRILEKSKDSVLRDVPNCLYASVSYRVDEAGNLIKGNVNIVDRNTGKKTRSINAEFLQKVRILSDYLPIDGRIAIQNVLSNNKIKTLYSVSFNMKQLTVGNDNYLYRLKNEKRFMTGTSRYIVSADNGLEFKLKTTSGAKYVFLNKDEKDELDEMIYNFLNLTCDAVTLKPWKTTFFEITDDFYMDNLKSITYDSSNEKVARVDKNGRIVAIKKGKATIYGYALLKNGEEKILVMKITVR